MSGADWNFRAVTPETWADMEALFDGRGGPRHCWCMVWRSDIDGASALQTAPDRKAAMERLVQAERPVGILGYDRGTPVAWCSIAPRPLFGKGLSNTKPNPGLWSLTCFFIRADHRKQCGFAALLAAAEAHAAKEGATAIEAYPVDPDSPSYRFSGFRPSFEAAGYIEIGRVGTRRYMVRKTLAD
jgi:GNAT superfamily N-acetyltransferase